MASESIGALYPTQIPGYADNADIQEAFRLYHYGSSAYSTANANTANLVNPSVAYTLNSLQEQISSAAGSIATSFVNAKGDLITASANDTPLILSVGSNGRILSANSATASGLEWITTSGITSVGILSSLAVTANVVYHIDTNAQAASYTLVLADDGKIVEVGSASPNTLTVPTNASVAFPIGTQITVIQTGTGQTTITPVSGTVTINATPGLKLRTQWSSCVLIKRATNTWVALGDLVL
jgi:hypothetical protein